MYSIIGQVYIHIVGVFKFQATSEVYNMLVWNEQQTEFPIHATKRFCFTDRRTREMTQRPRDATSTTRTSVHCLDRKPSPHRPDASSVGVSGTCLVLTRKCFHICGKGEVKISLVSCNVRIAFLRGQFYIVFEIPTGINGRFDLHKYLQVFYICSGFKFY